MISDSTRNTCFQKEHLFSGQPQVPPTVCDVFQISLIMRERKIYFMRHGERWFRRNAHTVHLTSDVTSLWEIKEPVS